MNEPLTLLLSGIAGGFLGAIFYGGLWWTVRRGLSSTRPALWFLVSLLVRTAIAVGGFYIIANQYPGRLLVCLLGFVIARLIVTQATQTRPVSEANHAH